MFFLFLCTPRTVTCVSPIVCLLRFFFYFIYYHTYHHQSPHRTLSAVGDAASNKQNRTHPKKKPYVVVVTAAWAPVTTQGMSPCTLMVAASLPRDDGHPADAEARPQQQQPATTAGWRLDRPRLRRSEPEPSAAAAAAAAEQPLRRRQVIVVSSSSSSAASSPSSNGQSHHYYYQRRRGMTQVTTLLAGARSQKLWASVLALLRLDLTHLRRRRWKQEKG